MKSIRVPVGAYFFGQLGSVDSENFTEVRIHRHSVSFSGSLADVLFLIACQMFHILYNCVACVLLIQPHDCQNLINGLIWFDLRGGTASNRRFLVHTGKKWRQFAGASRFQKNGLSHCWSLFLHWQTDAQIESPNSIATYLDSANEAALIVVVVVAGKGERRRRAVLRCQTSLSRRVWSPGTLHCGRN